MVFKSLVYGWRNVRFTVIIKTELQAQQFPEIITQLFEVPKYHDFFQNFTNLIKAQHLRSLAWHLLALISFSYIESCYSMLHHLPIISVILRYLLMKNFNNVTRLCNAHKHTRYSKVKIDIVLQVVGFLFSFSIFQMFMWYKTAVTLFDKTDISKKAQDYKRNRQQNSHYTKNKRTT